MTFNRFQYRVWNKYKKTFLPEVFLDNSGTLLTYNSLYESFNNLSHNDNVLCFALGQNKEGKIIYDGDIVNFPNSDDRDSYIIRYNSKLLNYGLILNRNYKIEEFPIELEYSASNNHMDVTIKRLRTMNIIGNIFENPELINQ